MRTIRAAHRSWFLALAAGASLLVAACGGAAQSANPAPASASDVPPSTAPAESATSSASAAACGTYSGPATTISYAMWGDTTELANQQKIVDAFSALNPSITVKVTVA
ncbi:MAG TPA: hypothetical protein VIU37_00460, partial [Candidatus Limnocylindrales bacterium]